MIITTNEETVVWEMGIPPRIGMVKYTYAPVPNPFIVSINFSINQLSPAFLKNSHTDKMGRVNT